MSQASAISRPKSRPKPDEQTVEFRILGVVAVSRGGKPIPLGGPKQRLVLAMLVLSANRVVSADRLIDQVWGDEPPEAARGTLQAYVSRLRKALGSDRIEARPPGYVLNATYEEVDALRFERLAADAHSRVEAEPQAARSLLDVALDLWRGPALDDLAGEPALRAEISRLEEQRLAAIEDRIAARMALGQHAQLVWELERLVAAHPLREPFSASLMLALYRSERQAEALAAFERIRHKISEDLGVDPSPGLRRLHERILRQDPELLPKGRRLRGYELIERIGEGANGVVHRAVQPTVRRDVAVKVIHRALANQPEFIRRFEQEAQIIARLEHPHIVPLHDYWREPDGAYLAMRYMRGGSLRDRLESQGSLSTRDASVLVEQICSALAFAHRQGLIHRDVRPANILYDEEGNCYLSDFGIGIDVAVSEALQRRYGRFAYYMAPEEIHSGEISAATDVYGLGLTVYEALVGRHAFADSPSSEIIERQLTSPVPSIGVARPDLPAAVGAVIARATEKQPASRFPDASSFAVAFREAVADGPKPTTVAPIIDRNPYKGLRAFEEADAPDFYGRDQLTAQLVARLKESGRGHRLLAVVGPSGSGKSSAVRAGLLPAIRRGNVPESARWFVLEMHPGSDPFRELELALLRVATEQPPSLAQDLEWGENALSKAIDRVLPADASQLLLFVDQFEELFTLVPEESHRNAFMDMLAQAVSDPNSRVRVVLTLRADFYDRPLLHPRFGELLARRTQPVPPMQSEDIEQAITGPAEAAGAKFEQGLIGAIVRDVAEEPGSLPLLQYALTQLFDRRTGSTLGVGVYRRMGGISGALSRNAEDLYQSLAEPDKEAARQVFLRLVSLGQEGSEDSRRRVLRTELAALEVEQSGVDRVLELFGAHRFLTFDRDPVTRTPTVEVAHEALLRSWRRLREWVDSGREDLRTFGRLSGGAKEWAADGRDPSFLLRGSRLELFEAWSRATHLATSGLEREYLDESLQARDVERAQERERRQRERILNRRALNRLRATVAVLVIGVLAVGSLAFLAQKSGTRAEQEARVAAARQLAAEADRLLSRNSDRSLSLALQAVEKTKTVDGTVLPEAEQVLHAAVQADRVLLAVPGHRAQFSQDGKSLLIVGPDPGQAEVRDVATGRPISRATVEVGNYWTDPDRPLLAITPDAKLFVTGSRRNTGLGAYDASTGKPWRAMGSPAYCCGYVWITPDGKSLVAVNDESCQGHSPWGTHVFDVDTGNEVNCLDTTGVWAFSPNSTRAMVATTDDWWQTDPGTVYVGDLRQPGLGKHLTLRGPSDGVNDAAWSADGLTVATSSPSSVMAWDSRTGRPLFTLPAPTGSAFATLAFGPRPGLMATGMEDGSAIVWNVSADGVQEIMGLAGHDRVVRSVAFSPDATRLVTGSDDGLIKVWDITAPAGGELLTVAGSGGLDISRDGRVIATGNEQGHVLVYDAATGKQLGDVDAHSGRVNAVNISPDGSRLASAASDGVVLSQANGGPNLKIPQEPSTAANVVMSPDGATVVVPTERGKGGIFDAKTGAEIWPLPANPGGLSGSFGTALDFSRDGRRIAIAGGFSGCFIYDSRGGIVSFPDTGFLDAVALRPDGRRLVAVTSRIEGGVVVVYDISKPFTVSALGNLEPNHAITGVTFSPDGKTIATSESDGTLSLWDGSTFRRLLVVANDANGKVVFSPDGTRLAYAARGGVVRVLTLRIDDLIRLANARLARSAVRN